MRMPDTGVSLLEFPELFNVTFVNERKAIRADGDFKCCLDEKARDLKTSCSSGETTGDRKVKEKDKDLAQSKRNTASNTTNTTMHKSVEETEDAKRKDSNNCKKEISEEGGNVTVGENAYILIEDSHYIPDKDIVREYSEIPEEFWSNIIETIRNGLVTDFGEIGDMDPKEAVTHEITKALKLIPGMDVDQKAVEELTKFISFNLSMLENTETDNSMEQIRAFFETVRIPEVLEKKVEFIDNPVKMEQVGFSENAQGNDTLFKGFVNFHKPMKLKNESLEQINELRGFDTEDYSELKTDPVQRFPDKEDSDLFDQLLKDSDAFINNEYEKDVESGFNLSPDLTNVVAKADLIPKYNVQQSGIVAKREDIVFQIVEKAKIMLGDEKHEMVIDLKPDSLGKLSLKVVTERGVVMAQFIAENEQVKSILEANMQFLKDALEKQGLNLNQCEVSVGQNGKEGTQRDDRYRHNSYNSPNVKAVKVSTSSAYGFSETDIFNELYGLPYGNKINLKA